MAVNVNGHSCRYAGAVPPAPGWSVTTHAFNLPGDVLRRGHNSVEVRNNSTNILQIVWLELAISNREGHWPTAGVEVASFYPK